MNKNVPELTDADKDAILKLVTEPNSWIKPRVAETASYLACVEKNEHHRRWAAMMLEAILTLLELNGVMPTPAILTAHLLEPAEVEGSLNALKAKGKFTQVLVPVQMLDRLIALSIADKSVRRLQFAAVIAHMPANI